MAEWEDQVAECARQYAPRLKATEEIYQPHGLFEQALPPHVQLDRISFRATLAYTERVLRQDLIIRAERLLLGDAPVVSESQPMPMPAKTPRGSRPSEGVALRREAVTSSAGVPPPRSAAARRCTPNATRR